MLFFVVSLLGPLTVAPALAQDTGTPAVEVTEEPAADPAQTTEQPAAEAPVVEEPVEQPVEEVEEAAPAVEQPAQEAPPAEAVVEQPVEEAAPAEQPVDDTSTVMTEVAPEPVEVAAAPVSCQVADGVSPWIASDLGDYPPGAWVTLYGGDWAPGQTVEIFVDDDGVADAEMGAWSHATTVTADGSGAFTYGFSLPEWFVANYYVTATGECSQAATTFTDGNVRVAVSGITSATIGWEKFNGSTTCSGTPASSNSVSTGASFTTATAADSGQSVRLTAPSVAGFTFQGWSSGDTTAQLCVAGSNGTQNRTANYVTAAVVKQNQTITFTSTSPASPKVGDTYTPAATGGGSGNPVTFAVTGTCSFSGGVVTMTGAGTCTITADQAGNASYNAAPQVTQILSVGKATATVTLSDLTYTYDGAAKAATATTMPAGLTVTITYAGSATAPSAAGSYAVVATIDDANHEGTTSGTLVIDKATATVSLSDLEHVYDGSAKAATVTTQPEGLEGDVTVTYNGESDLPVAAGSYTVVATLDNANYSGEASDALVIDKGTAMVGLSSLEHVYDGSAKAAVVTTTPTGLGYNITYGGNTAAPTAVGEYAVVATIDDANYEGTASDTLVIAKADQTISFPMITGKTFGDAPFTVAATSDSGLAVSFTATGACTISSTTVTITGAGTCTVTASQTGDTNYNVATQKVQNVSIDKATWTVKGFYQPLDGNGVVNTAKGGSTIPVKFEVFQGDTEITDPTMVKVLVKTTTCPSATTAVDEVEETVTGTSGLRYDPTSGQFIYTWKTSKSVGTCYTLSVAAAGTNEAIPSSPTALVKLK